MRTFAFIPKKSLTNVYGSFLRQYRKYDGIMEMIKIGTLAFFLVLFVFSYLIFINKASTRGYFLRKENQKLSTISFQFEILKTRMLDYKQQNWESVAGSSFRRDVVDVTAEVVKIPTSVEVGMDQKEVKGQG